MQQQTGSIAGFYKAQVESAQDLASASMEGFERIQQLALQAMRQQLDHQFRLANTIAARSAEAVVDPQLARPARDQMINVQRQIAETFVVRSSAYCRRSGRRPSARWSRAARSAATGTSRLPMLMATPRCSRRHFSSGRN